MLRAFPGLVLCLLVGACDVAPLGQTVSQAETERRLSGQKLELVGPRGGLLGHLILNPDGTGMASIVSGETRPLRWQVIEGSLCLNFAGQNLNRARDCSDLVWLSNTSLRIKLPGGRKSMIMHIVT